MQTPHHMFTRMQTPHHMFTTTISHNHSQPLIVRGPGAGAAVTAAGVFGDIVTVARALAAGR